MLIPETTRSGGRSEVSGRHLHGIGRSARHGHDGGAVLFHFGRLDGLETGQGLPDPASLPGRNHRTHLTQGSEGGAEGREGGAVDTIVVG